MFISSKLFKNWWLLSWTQEFYLITWSPVFSGPLETSPRSTRGPEVPWVRWSHPQTRAEGNQCCARCWSPDQTAVSIRLRVHTERPWLSQSTADSPQPSDQIIPAESERQSSRPRALCELHWPEEFKVREGKSWAPPFVQYEPEGGLWVLTCCEPVQSQLSSTHDAPKCYTSAQNAVWGSSSRFETQTVFAYIWCNCP